MEITDLEGRIITITDLDGSITMVEQYIGYCCEGDCESLKRLEERRKAYWQDVHEKLLLLKAHQTGDNI